MAEAESSATHLLPLATKIVAALVSNQNVPLENLPMVIREVYTTLRDAGRDLVAAGSQKPAVPVAKSVTHGYIVCLEDGRKLKMLKRHLRAAYGMSPAQYREKWGLPLSYPMVAPRYAEQRSALAKQLGLGLKRSSDRSSGATA
jgi:predicted transcriptional regulator